MSYPELRWPARASNPPRPSRSVLGYWRWCCALVLLLAGQLLSPAWAAVSWQRMGAPDGGIASVLAVHPANANTAYAGAPKSGVYKTTDGGANWVRASTGLGAGRVTDIRILPTAPDTVFALVAGSRPIQSGRIQGSCGLRQGLRHVSTWAGAGKAMVSMPPKQAPDRRSR